MALVPAQSVFLQGPHAGTNSTAIAVAPLTNAGNARSSSPRFPRCVFTSFVLDIRRILFLHKRYGNARVRLSTLAALAPAIPSISPADLFTSFVLDIRRIIFLHKRYGNVRRPPPSLAVLRPPNPHLQELPLRSPARVRRLLPRESRNPAHVMPSESPAANLVISHGCHSHCRDMSLAVSHERRNLVDAARWRRRRRRIRTERVKTPSRHRTADSAVGLVRVDRGGVTALENCAASLNKNIRRLSKLCVVGRSKKACGVLDGRIVVRGAVLNVRKVPRLVLLQSMSLASRYRRTAIQSTNGSVSPSRSSGPGLTWYTSPPLSPKRCPGRGSRRVGAANRLAPSLRRCRGECQSRAVGIRIYVNRQTTFAVQAAIALISLSAVRSQSPRSAATLTKNALISV